MKKKVLIVVGVVALVAVVLGVGSMAGMFPWQYLSEDKVNAFIEDSHYAFAYNFPKEIDKDEYDSVLSAKLEDGISASVYASRNNFDLETSGDSYVVAKETLENEKASLFVDAIDDSSDSRILKEEGDNYLLSLKDEDNQLTYEITDSFYGLIGSESTRITVTYKLNDTECTLEYVLAEDKESPYKFKVSDITYVSGSADVAGVWMSEKVGKYSNDYYAMAFNEDGSGSLTDMSTPGTGWTGIPFSYEINDKEIIAHMGSADDNSSMSYDASTDTITYDNTKYTRVDDDIAELYGSWLSETNDEGEYVELLMEPDGTGFAMNRPLNVGVPIMYEIHEDGSISAQDSSPEFVFPMEYDAENQTITFEGIVYKRS